MQKSFCPYGFVLLIFFLFISCAGTPPKKEFALARMALIAASDAEASSLSPVEFEKAQDYMKLCERAFYERLYSNAKEYALQARQFAEQAEAKALEKKKQSDFIIQNQEEKQ